MQTDMHYYGTYAMACAAGIRPENARIIATAAQYVDDSDDFHLELKNGTYLNAGATAHHPVNKHNLEDIDQRIIWVPFHFLPGNEGNTLQEKLVCSKDSQIAREFVAHHISLANEGYGLALIGIAAHVYADTFSHYGFSGISSSCNHVDADSIQLTVMNPDVLDYIKGKAKEFREKYIEGRVANVVGLGHGSVSTFPDRPYLTWHFTYDETGKSSGERNNQATFLEACGKLHQMFTDFAVQNPACADNSIRREFSDIEAVVRRILAVEADMKGRIEAWQSAVAGGEIYNRHDPIPEYEEQGFKSEIASLSEHDSATVCSTNLYRFLKAARIHRDYVLDELLPKHGIEVLHRL